MTLEGIKQQIIHDDSNDWATRQGWLPVYTAGETARILIVGQAPGIRAQTSHTPWNDASGQNLRDWLGVSYETFYDSNQIALVPMDFYFPGSGARGDLPPRKDFAQRWHPLLLKEMPNIQLTILVGKYAQDHYLKDGVKESLTATVQTYKDYLPNIIPIIHPSPRNNIWHKKHPWFKTEIVPVLRETVASILNDQRPSKN